MSIAIDVIFEKQQGGQWVPVPSQELRPGDIARMRTVAGEVLTDEKGEAAFEVSGTNGVDPDTHSHFDLCLSPRR